MKYLLKFSALVMVLTLFNCVTEPMEFTDGPINAMVEEIENSVSPDYSCEDQAPKARLVNNGTIDIDLEIYDVVGNLIAHEYEIEPGDYTDWMEFAEGETTFLISNPDADKIIVKDMNSCMVFDMVVGSNNQLESDQAVQF